MSTNSEDVAHEGIAELMAEISRLFRSELRRRTDADPSLPTPFQCEAMTQIARRPGLSVVGLSDLTGRDKAQVTRTLAELEAAGYVRRAPSARDRRSVRLSLTTEGEDVARRALRGRLDVARTLVQPLTSDECRALQGMLVSMRSALHAGGAREEE